MAVIYTKRLFAGNVSSVGNTLLFTASSGLTTIVRDIAVQCYSTGSNEAVIQTLPGQALAFFASTAQYSTFHWTGRQVIVPGEGVEMGVFSGGWTCMITGYELNP
jgi:hypothetical protein